MNSQGAGSVKLLVAPIWCTLGDGMREPHPDFVRLVVWAFAYLVILPGAWIAVFQISYPLLDNDWFKLPIILYFAIPAALAIFTQFGQAHFTFFTPQPVSGVGWFLLFLFYSGLSVAVAWVVFRLRRRRRRGRTAARR
jgi:hypothetical protein